MIDHSIDVRYESDAIEAFNKFIRKWCGDYYPHLIDNDENDGEYMRDKIRELISLTEEKAQSTAVGASSEVIATQKKDQTKV